MKSGLFTFSIDDGHPLDNRVAELLERHQIPATFYVPLKNSEGHPVLNPHDIRELSKTFEIGSHTLDHKPLTHLSRKSGWKQIYEGKIRLENLLGKKILGFSYPLGEQYAIHRKMVEIAGFSYARTTHNLYIDPGKNRYALPVTIQFFPHKRSVFMRNFLMQGNWKKRYRVFNLMLKKRNLIERISALLDFSIHENRVFHLWCHSIDIERRNLWRALDAFLYYVSQRTTLAQRITNAELANSLENVWPYSETNIEYA